MTETLFENHHRRFRNDHCEHVGPFLNAYHEALSLVMEQFKDEQMVVAKQTATDIEENIRFLVRELELLS